MWITDVTELFSGTTNKRYNVCFLSFVFFIEAYILISFYNFFKISIIISVLVCGVTDGFLIISFIEGLERNN